MRKLTCSLRQLSEKEKGQRTAHSPKEWDSLPALPYCPSSVAQNTIHFLLCSPHYVRGKLLHPKDPPNYLKTMDICFCHSWLEVQVGAAIQEPGCLPLIVLPSPRAFSLSARSRLSHRNIHVPAQGNRKGRAAPCKDTFL